MRGALTYRGAPGFAIKAALLLVCCTFYVLSADSAILCNSSVSSATEGDLTYSAVCLATGPLKIVVQNSTDGNSTLFWEDTWGGRSTNCSSARLCLYNHDDTANTTSIFAAAASVDKRNESSSVVTLRLDDLDSGNATQSETWATRQNVSCDGMTKIENITVSSGSDPFFTVTGTLENCDCVMSSISGFDAVYDAGTGKFLYSLVDDCPTGNIGVILIMLLMALLLCAGMCACTSILAQRLCFHWQVLRADPAAAARMGYYLHEGLSPAEISALPSKTIATKKKMDAAGAETGGAGGGDCGEGNDAVCAICLGDYEPGEKLRILPCAHQYHDACAAEWLSKKATCPMCKATLGSGPQWSKSPARITCELLGRDVRMACVAMWCCCCPRARVAQLEGTAAAAPAATAAGAAAAGGVADAAVAAAAEAGAAGPNVPAFVPVQMPTATPPATPPVSAPVSQREPFPPA
ncbi:unnamed protein product [Phaeothamnion confervicola]